MTVYVTAAFTAANATALTAYTAETGGGWTRHGSASNTAAPVINGNKLECVDNYTSANYFNTTPPATANYEVKLAWTWNGNTNLLVGPLARAHGALGSAYAFAYRRSDGGVQLRNTSGGTMGSAVSLSPTSGVAYESTLKVNGTSLEGFVQRKSDDQWLTSGGTWQSTKVACCTATDSAITATWYGGFWFADSNETTRSTIDDFSVFDDLVASATGTTLTGPSGGVVGAASTNFTVGVTPVGGEITGTLTVTPNDGGAGGSFSPTTLALTTGSPTGTFVYTPATTGAKTIGITDNGGLADAASLTYTVSAAPATAITLTGPSSGVVGAPSSNFSVAANGAITGTVVVTPDDNGGGGTFSPTSINLSSGSPTGTFTYAAASAGAKSVGVTNNGALTNPADITFTASAAAATAITLTGPTAGAVGSPSSAFSVAANGVITGTVVVTPSDSAAGGTFTPSSVSINSASPTATFTYTASSPGAKSISTSDNGGLTDPTPISYTASASLPYTVTNLTVFGQPSCILLPTSYNSGTPTDLIIFCHGQNQAQTAPDTETDPRTMSVVLCGAGFIIAASAARSNSWGNPGAVEDNVQLERYMRANFNIRHTYVWGQSMGGIVGLNLISSGRIDVKGAFFHAPVCSLQALHNNGAGAYAGIIDAAYGITGSGDNTYAIKTRGHDPLLRTASAFHHIPMRFYASASDGTVPKATNSDPFAALLAGWCREAAVVTATGGHIDTSHIQTADTLAFLQRCQAAPVAKGPPATTRTVTVTLTSDGTTPRASLTGLKWAWWDQITPNLAEWPTDRGSAETTDGSGVLSISVKSNLPVGGIGYLVVTNSDGTLTQSPVRLAAQGPAQVGA